MRAASVAAALLLVFLGRSTQAQGDLDTLLARAGAYVQTFQKDFGSVVAEERYEQEIRPAIVASTIVRRGASSGPVRTVLVSDFLLVQVPGEGWWPFRDVFERDGKAVRDRQERLTELFLSDSKDAFGQAGRIMNESARYNIGDVNRNINVPTLPLPFITESQRGNFKFSRATEDDSENVRVLEYRETARPTFVKTANNRDLPVYGRFWIEEQTGIVHRTELHAVDTSVEGHITVTYQPDPGIGMWAPARMEERYRRPRDSNEVRGVATYSRFRRFSVTTTEDIGK